MPASSHISSSSNPNQIYDVVIVGAGPGGSTAAHYLAKQGMDVLLLDKADFPRDKTCGDGLTPRALHQLADMGIFEEADRAGFRVNGLELHAKSGKQMRAEVPAHPEYPNQLLIVPRLQLDDIIRQRAISSGARYQSPTLVRNIVTKSDRVMIQADFGGRKETYHARVAILAVGANMRMLMDLGILTHNPSVLLAARAYIEGMAGLNDYIQVHLGHVPQPGYGWVFPISETSANVGVGYWQKHVPWKKSPSSARSALEQFYLNPKMQAMLAKAKVQGAIRSYPLRIDFATAPTYAERILLVGETAGLVSPLTGEGIDFAMESAHIAAQFLENSFERGDFSLAGFASYDRLLRKSFQSLFLALGKVRKLYLNPTLMSRAIAAAGSFPEIKQLLVNVMLSQRHPSEMLNLRVLRNIVMGL